MTVKRISSSITAPGKKCAENIRSIFSTITANYGYGSNEAMEIGFWDANQLRETTDVDQVIVVGDAPPNTKQEGTSVGERATGLLQNLKLN